MQTFQKLHFRVTTTSWRTRSTHSIHWIIHRAQNPPVSEKMFSQKLETLLIWRFRANVHVFKKYESVVDSRETCMSTSATAFPLSHVCFDSVVTVWRHCREGLSFLTFSDLLVHATKTRREINRWKSKFCVYFSISKVNFDSKIHEKSLIILLHRKYIVEERSKKPKNVFGCIRAVVWTFKTTTKIKTFR